ncbi:hypothetical protein SAMN05216605_114172 [Pseudomonas abietaniphila]|uniref:Uncharacterized protein n=1 Tax=Pseudomonas abietaniphila TaxID=89065 RepID=A0A1G8LL55_9PSED|nr:hypothetical protein SAMN05216605_114172 [Pseudomonas abietaniphila]
MKTLLALISVARCACSLMQCAYSHQVPPADFQFGGVL